MIKEGDIVEWRGVNKTLRGVVVKSEDGTLHARLDNGCTFPLNDLCLSKSAKLIVT